MIARRTGVLILRPADSAAATAAAVRAMGFAPVLLPLAKIVDTGNPIPAGRFDAVALTSGAAARVDSARRPDALSAILSLPAYCVGAATAGAARKAGWQAVRSADGDAADLARMLIRDFAGRKAKVLYLCGHDRAFDLSAAIRPHEILVVAVAVYRAELIEPACDDLIGHIRRCDTVLLYSARTARHFFAMAARCRADLSKLTLLAISETVAAVIPAELRSAARVAAQPEEPAMLALLRRDGGSDPEPKR
jgi:uroporphyrinogen-III synthase